MKIEIIGNDQLTESELEKRLSTNNQSLTIPAHFLRITKSNGESEIYSDFIHDACFNRGLSWLMDLLYETYLEGKKDAEKEFKRELDIQARMDKPSIEN